MAHKESAMEMITIKSAIAGDHESARRVLKIFCDHVERGMTPGPMTLKYVEQAFRRVIAGEKADVALRLAQANRGKPKKRKRFPQTEDEHREVGYAKDIIRLVDEGHKLSEAYMLVAEMADVHVMKVRRAWKKWRIPCEALSSLDKQLRDHDHARLELLEKLRQEGLALFNETGAATASENPNEAPVASWNTIVSKPAIAHMVKQYTNPIEGLGGELLKEEDLRASFVRGFRNARKRLRRATTSQG